MRTFTILLASQPNRPKTISAEVIAAADGLVGFYDEIERGPGGDPISSRLVFATSVTNVLKIQEGAGDQEGE